MRSMKIIAAWFVLIGAVALAQTPHSVLLKWNEANPTEVVGYNVYRGTASGGPYQLLNTSGVVTALTYSDTTVSDGATYYYIVRSFDGNVESGNSNQAKVTVNPLAPSGLTATPQ